MMENCMKLFSIMQTGEIFKKECDLTEKNYTFYFSPIYDLFVCDAKSLLPMIFENNLNEIVI